MSLTKSYIEDLEEQQKQKEEALLEIPETIAESYELIGSLKEQLIQGEKEIKKLNEKLEENNSLKSKIKDYLIGGFVGAIFGVLLSAIL